MTHTHPHHRPDFGRAYTNITPHSSSSSANESYFSDHAPSTAVSPAITPLTPYTNPSLGSGVYSPMPSASAYSSTSTAPLDYPVITASVTSRNQTMENPLREFALHIPQPPALSLSGASRQPVPSVHTPASSSSSSSSTSTCSSPRSSSSAARPHGYTDLPSPMDRSRRMPTSTHAQPQMTIASTVYYYTFNVKLPKSIEPEMVTVSANRGDKLKVVADVWHLENESHYEWQISFPPRDIDMSAVHARFDAEKNLTIDVRRLPRLYR